MCACVRPRARACVCVCVWFCPRANPEGYWIYYLQLRVPYTCWFSHLRNTWLAPFNCVNENKNSWDFKLRIWLDCSCQERFMTLNPDDWMCSCCSWSRKGVDRIARWKKAGLLLQLFHKLNSCEQNPLSDLGLSSWPYFYFYFEITSFDKMKSFSAGEQIKRKSHTLLKNSDKHFNLDTTKLSVNLK